MNYVLKYVNGEFVGEDSASGGYPYPTRHLSKARMFNELNEAKTYLLRLKSQFPNDGFDNFVFKVVVSMA